MKSNFHFLATDWPEVLEHAAKAESLAYSDPSAAGAGDGDGGDLQTRCRPAVAV
jgi:hypothetical protein